MSAYIHLRPGHEPGIEQARLKEALLTAALRVEDEALLFARLDARVHRLARRATLPPVLFALKAL